MSSRRQGFALSKVLLYVAALAAGAMLAEISAHEAHRPIARHRTRAGARVVPVVHVPPVAAHATVAVAAAAPAPERAPAPEPTLAAAAKEPLPRPIERALGANYKQGMTISGVTHHRIVLFTFDDGP